ncbi:hypothetical protein, partial [Streptomyces kasugaensis]|uniref:hypothetical protein n=1 Tax=Streptomyces kasugaensis TaxID=1946 RepID=UPI001A952953
MLVPGGILTGLIGLCWMTHRFGLTAVVAAVVTCAAAAAIGIARRNRRSGRRATPQFGGWPGGR